MSFPKILIILSVLLFGTIAVVSWLKQDKTKSNSKSDKIQTNEVEIVLEPDTALHEPAKKSTIQNSRITTDESIVDPDVDRVDSLFHLGEPQLSIVETITYHSRVPWLAGRQAWVGDYATHYSTSRHFIARSLNGGPDYESQTVAEGDRFNVLRNDKEISFYLLLDISRSKMWFYVLDGQNRVLLKTYKVGLGRIDTRSPSGCLTPIGKYSLGNKVAVFKPGHMGTFNNQQTEMIRVFGTRWIPFDKEIGPTSAPAKGYGIHGTPWISSANGQLQENSDTIAKYESDGCIRVSTKDMEELFSIIITKPTTIEIVKHFEEAQLPGKFSQLQFNQSSEGLH